MKKFSIASVALCALLAVPAGRTVMSVPHELSCIEKAADLRVKPLEKRHNYPIFVMEKRQKP